ncbi:MAG: hypothetical protein LBV41_09200 [Cytophagaceae bacterium]|nr:hypothetical protein [Cytophagaceae bacterium]
MRGQTTTNAQIGIRLVVFQLMASNWFSPNGKIVRFGNFGYFQILLGSEGAKTADKFNASMIKTRKWLFVRVLT